MVDFAALPPEINSARMYAGPGSGPLLAAAAAWDGLAAQLESFAAGYSATLAGLQGHHWSGPAATAMVAAAAPYVAWLNTTSTGALQAAVQTRAAAAAYEIAYAATVPPMAVAANRAQLAMLVATNFFGQNLPAIAATDAMYAEMWAQDAAAMYGYAESAAPAAALTRFDRAPDTTSGSAPGGDPSTGPPAPPVGHQHDVFQVVGTLRHPVNEFVVNVPHTVGDLAQFASGFPGGTAPVKAAVQVGAPAARTGAATRPGGGGPVLASAGRAVPVGKLSAPQSWSMAAQAVGNELRPSQLPGADPRAAAGEAAKTVKPVPVEPPPPVMGPMQQAAQRRGNRAYRPTERRFRIPRPPVAG